MNYVGNITNNNRIRNLRVLKQVDPTRTLTLRKTLERKITKRFRWLKGQINKSIITNDCFGLKIPQNTNYVVISINEPIPKNKFALESNAKKINSFIDWLQNQTDTGILETITNTPIEQAIGNIWTNKYITNAYKKGIARGRQELKNKGYIVPELQGGFDLQSTFNSSANKDTVEVLYSRTYIGLKGIIDEMLKQVFNVLAQDITENKSPNEIAKEINDRVEKVGVTRSKKLAQTEIVRAHHQATIKEYERWGAIGVAVLAELLTAGDDRVCSICKKAALKDNGFGKGIYTLEQAMGLIPLHSSCRCCCIPVDVVNNEKIQNILNGE